MAPRFGVVVFCATVALLVYCLPPNGKTHRFVGTEFEPYVAIAFTAGVALGFTTILSAMIEMIG